MKRNIFNIFLKNTENNFSKNFIKIKENNKWKWYSHGHILSYVNNCSYKLKQYNLKRGDRIAYKGKNSLEWLTWNLATYSNGYVWVPMYAEQDIDYCNHIINDSQSKLLITNENIKIKDIQTISNVIESDSNCNNISNINNDVSNFIYTSGTTGKPKGVVLTHENILSNLDGIHERFKNNPDNITSLNLLPWAHIYGLTCELYFSLLYNNKIALCSDKTAFIKECKEVKPDVLYVVPKVLETVKSKINFLDKPVIKNLLPYVLKRIFGGKLQHIFIGGAKLDKNTKYFFEKNNVKICEGYGTSELSPIISLNHSEKPRNIDSIGKILDNVEVKIIDDEICVNGPNLMSGYWNNLDETKKVLFEYNNKTWYKTGDSGYIKDDFLFYTGRISENYKLSNGKFVNVSELESKIKKYISGNFIVYGDNYDYNILITDSDKKPELNIINSNIENYLQIKTIILINKNVMEKFLTPKMSIKRKALINYLIENNCI